MDPTRAGSDLLYFAYGANLSRAHMALWCPDAVPLAPATWPDHRLVFRTWVDVVPSPGDAVQGALYEVGARDLAALDEFEECPTLYRRVRVRVVSQESPFEAMTYRMNPGRTLALPEPDYLGLILQGYEDWQLDRSLLAVMERETHNAFEN
ncbi:MAG TPA: gamma-glutamylcyclotransferase family protein [Phycisphaerae bacterium]|nr:gamma-glutamylcyclotransferase family protein [Phycisphaerae bacterium]